MYEEEDYERIKTLLPLSMKPGTIIGVNRHLVPKNLVKYIGQLIKEYNLNDSHFKDFCFFACFYVPIIKGLRDEEDIWFDMKKKYQKNCKEFAKLFSNCDGSIEFDIELVSFKVRGLERRVTINDKVDNKLLDRITYALYQLHLTIEKEQKSVPKVQHDIKSVKRRVIRRFYWLYIYLNNTIKKSKKDSCRIIAKFIELSGYDLADTTEQKEEDYIYDILKGIDIVFPTPPEYLP